PGRGLERRAAGAPRSESERPARGGELHRLGGVERNAQMNLKLDLLKQGLLRVPHDLGVPGIASAALLAAAALFHVGVVKPLQARDAEAAQRVARQAPRAQPGEPASSADKLAAVYQHLSREQSPTDWLAKLHA